MRSVCAAAGIKSPVDILLEATPKHLNMNDMKRDMDKIPGVASAHHMHAWSLTSGKTLFSSHILVKNSKNSMEILQKTTELLKAKYKIYFSTLQIEDKYTNEQPKEIEIGLFEDWFFQRKELMGN